MAERGNIGGLDFRMEQYPPAAAPVYTPPVTTGQPVGTSLPEYSNDPLAVREKLTSDYYNNMAMVRDFAESMASKGINPFEPDWSQPDGGLAFQTMQKLKAGVAYASNALRNEFYAEKQMRPLEASGQVRLKPGVKREGLYYSDPRNFYSTALDPVVTQANQVLGDSRYTRSDSQRLNEAVRDPRVQYYQEQMQKDPDNAIYYQRQIEALIQNTPQTFIQRGGDTGAANSGISAYVKKWSEIANGLGFQPGESFDQRGNRIDISRPSEFVGRQLGYLADGKKFILDRFEKIVQPDGSFIVEAVDTTGKSRVQVDPNNIVGSLRSFIETNEGATALKDLNSFFRTQGFDTATQSVPANLFAPRATDVTEQTDVAPKVMGVRENISRSLDYLAEGGIGRFFLNALALGTNNPSALRSTEIEYATPDGRTLKIKKDGDLYKISNYRDIFGTPKNGVIEINGKKTPVNGVFEKVPKATLQAMLEKFGVVNVMLKDSDGNVVATEPIGGGVVNQQSPSQPTNTDDTDRYIEDYERLYGVSDNQKRAVEAFIKKFGRKPTQSETKKIFDKYR
jgi:hypothetical protein